MTLYRILLAAEDLGIYIYIYIVLILLRKMESFIRNMRWKAYFFLNSIDNSYNEMQEKYGFKT